MIGQGKLFAFLGDERKVEIIAVKMDQALKRSGKSEKSLQNLRFLIIIFSQPLFGTPLSIQIISAADQVQAGRTGSEAGGLYIKKKDPLQKFQSVQGISDGKVFQCFLANSHGRPPF